MDARQPVLANALQPMETYSERLGRGIAKVGPIFDERGLGGALVIRAALLAHAGVEDRPSVQEQIGRALAAFRAVLAVSAPGDLLETYRGRQVLRQGAVWPSIYHLRLLASTHGWRLPENRQPGRALALARLPRPAQITAHRARLVLHG